MADVSIRDSFRESTLVRARLVTAGAVLVLLTLVLLGRLAWLQLAQEQRFTTLAQKNRISLIPLAPVRGLIFDRNGVVLARNYPVYTLEAVPDQVRDMDGLLKSLGELVDLSEDDLRRFKRLRRRRSGFENLAIKESLSEEEAARFAVNRHRFPGVELRARLQRHYPLGALGVHAVGYVGRISERDLERLDTARYRGTSYVGKLGVEASYEDTLLGAPGFQEVETNAHGRVVRVLKRQPPRAGQNLHLSLDAGLQAVAEAALGDHRGAVVAIEPDTGDVLALVSTPTYDPNPFVDGIDSRSYAELRDSPNRPLLDRALVGRYAPGSTVKGLMAIAAQDSGRSPARTTFCPGYFRLPGRSHRYRCWKKTGHGHMNLHDAVVQSCDVYFYQLAAELGIDRMHDFLSGFGFGKPTGVDLRGESAGLMPSREWKRRERGQPWYPGETVIAGIGQGYMLVTPLQLAQAMAVVATKGHANRPRLVRALQQRGDPQEVPLQPHPLEPLKIRARYFDTAIAAMTDVVHGARGTARRIGYDAPYRIAGKTGTAQVIGIAQDARYNEKLTPEHLRDHALFVAIAPAEAPRIAVAVIVENAGHGGSVAAPVARKVMDFFLNSADAAQAAPSG
ncbi:MAG: penicillin-binding protein 2 [Gammaproteobacteria bacterium]|nr:penicillin-binding protein 2 [Gammaproteobacteria bacterium]